MEVERIVPVTPITRHYHPLGTCSHRYDVLQAYIFSVNSVDNTMSMLNGAGAAPSVA